MVNYTNAEIAVVHYVYGLADGNATEARALWKEELKKSHPILMSHDRMEVNENLFSLKAREGAVSALKRNGISCGSEGDSLCGITGNFRKLEVD